MMYLQLLTVLLLLLPSLQAKHEYAAACIPHSEYYNNLCYLNIISPTTANIEIHTLVGSDSFTLPAGTLYQREFDEEFHPTIDSESKAIRISSDVELQVLVYKTTTGIYHQDVYMVPDQRRESNTYFTSAYYRTGEYPCGDAGYKQFYLVISDYDGTFVNVTQQDGTAYSLELPAFGTFTRMSSDPDDYVAMGTMITSSKAINVVSGNLCVRNSVDDQSGDSYASNIPETTSLGKEYVVPKLISTDASPAGFSVSVVATEDDTIVESDGEVEVIQRGVTAMFEYEYQNRSVIVNCSKDCLAVQFAKSRHSIYSMFMQQILPAHEFYTSAYFTTLDAHSTSYLSLVIEGESAGDDLFLNGISLGYLTWTPINGYSSAELAIAQGSYELESVDGRPFAAYVYLHMMVSGAGAGYALLPTESSRVAPAPAAASRFVQSMVPHGEISTT